MVSLFSDQFRRQLERTIARRKDKAPHTVASLKTALRNAIRQVERHPDAGRLMRNQVDYPGGRFVMVGYWQLVYRIDGDTVEFMALLHVAL